MTLTWNDPVYDGPIDPLAAFRYDTMNRFRAAGPLQGEWWIVTIQLSQVRMQGFIKNIEDYKLSRCLRISPVNDAERAARNPEDPFLTIYVKRPLLDALNRPKATEDGPGRADLGVSGMLLGGIVPDAFLNAPSDAPDVSPEHIFVEDGTVVMAVIDSGIAFAHELFRTGPISSRVEFMWIMETTTPAGPTFGPPPVQGRYLEKSEIDDELDKYTTNGILDEAGFYRATGLIDYARPGFKPASLRLSHGTHVMGLAAGYLPADNQQMRPIIAVQLPTSQVDDPSGIELDASITEAIDYILERHDRFRIVGKPGKRPPLAVNFSFGNFAGPHDGTGPIDEIIDTKLRGVGQRKIETLLPAGNGNLSRCHAEMAFSTSTPSHTLDLRVQPDDRSASVVEIWMPFVSPHNKNLVNISVTPPGGGTATTGTLADTDIPLLDAVNQIVGQLSYRFIGHPTRRGLFTVAIVPTASVVTPVGIPPLAPIGLAPSGVWKIVIAGDKIQSNQKVHAWVRRDETLPGFPPFGRQAFFDNSCYERLGAFGEPLATDPPQGTEGGDCVVRRAGTLSGFACGKQPSVIAGYVEGDQMGVIAGYSAQGPITPTQAKTAANRLGPDAAAASDDSLVMRGVLSAGSACGSLLPMNGTSVAAPAAAEWVGNRLSAKQPANRAAVFARGQAGNVGYGTPDPIEERSGGGRMDLGRRLGPPRLGPN